MTDTPKSDSAGSGSEADRLREIVAECLERIEDEGLEAVEATCRAHPDLADRIRKRVAKLAGLGLVTEGGEDRQDHPERLGEFVLQRRLGSGGMGVVYLAFQESLQREVALKIVRPEHMFFPGARERFRREVEAVARLAHPGIVPIHSVGEAGGVPFFAMERIVGLTLAEILDGLRERARSRLSGRDLAALLPEEETAVVDADPARVFGRTWTEVAVRLVRKLAEALEHAHQRGVLHRDLKPSNVMVTKGGRVVLMDFGLALSEGSQKLTRTGAVLGSVPYMAPEQLRGDTDRIDARTDVYGLGVLLYELLTFVCPFQGASIEVTRANVLRGEPRSIDAITADVPEDVQTICLCAMDPDPARRYVSVAELAHDIDRYLELRPIAGKRASSWQRTKRLVQRHPAAAAAVLLAGLVVVGGPLSYAFGVAQQRDIAVSASREAERHAYAARIAAADASLKVNDIAEARRNLERCPEDLRAWEWGYLRRQCDTARKTIRLDGFTVRHLEVTSDGATLLGLCTDDLLRTWVTDTGALRGVLGAPTERCRAMALHPLDREVATWSAERGLVFLSAADGSVVRTLPSPLARVLSLTYVGDGSTLVCQDEHGENVRIDATTGAVRTRLLLKTNLGPPAVAIRDTVPIIAGLDRDGELGVWNLDDGSLVQKLPERYGFSSIVINRAGSVIAAGVMRNGLIRVVSMRSPGRGLSILTDQPATVMRFATDDTTLVTAHPDGALREWNSVSQGELTGTYRGHAESVIGFAMARTGNVLASSAQDKTLKVWSIGHDDERILVAARPFVRGSTILDDWAEAIAFDASAERIAMAEASGAVLVRDRRGECIELFLGHERRASAVAFLDEGGELVSASDDDTLRYWRIGEQRATRVVACPGHAPYAIAVRLRDRAVLTSGRDGTLRLWSGAGEPVWSVPVSGLRGAVAGFSREGDHVIVTTGERGTEVFVAADGSRARVGSVDPADPRLAPGIALLLAGERRISDPIGTRMDGRPLIAIDPTGARIAIATRQSGIRVHDARTGDLLLAPQSRGTALTDLAFDRTGRDLVTAPLRAYAKIWSSKEIVGQTRTKEDTERLAGVRFFANRPVDETGAETLAAAQDKLSPRELEGLRAAIRQRGAEPECFVHEARALALPNEGPVERAPRALAAAQRAVREMPDSPQARIALAIATLRAGTPADALVAADHALVLRPRDPLAVAVRAESLRLLGRLDEARAAAEIVATLLDEPGTQFDVLVRPFVFTVATALRPAKR